MRQRKVLKAFIFNPTLSIQKLLSPIKFTLLFSQVCSIIKLSEAENNQKYFLNNCCDLIGQFCFETFIKNSFGLAEQLLGISESGKTNKIFIILAKTFVFIAVRLSVMLSGDHVQDAPSGSRE